MLSLREDYVAALDPYAPLVFNRLRARFYMERMGAAAGLEAIRKPAELAGRPFAEGVAEKLVDDLRQVRVPGQEATVAGPVRGAGAVAGGVLSVVEELGETDRRTKAESRRHGLITFDDLARSRRRGPGADAVLRGDAGRRAGRPGRGRGQRAAGAGLVRQGADHRGRARAGWCTRARARPAACPTAWCGPCSAASWCAAEARGGDTWIELVHDRFVEPIRASNAAWFPQHLSALQRQAALWDEQGRSSGLLLRDAALAEAEAWAAAHPEELEPDEQEFLAACRQAQDAVERERRQSRRIRILGIVAGVVAILAIAAAIWGWRSSAEATRQKKIAVEPELPRQALAQDQLDRQAGLALLQEAYALKEKGDAQGAIDKFRAAKATKTDLGIDVETEIEDVRRQVATQLGAGGGGAGQERDFPGGRGEVQGGPGAGAAAGHAGLCVCAGGAFCHGGRAEDDA